MADENESFSTKLVTISEDHTEYWVYKKASERGYLIKFVNGRRTEYRQCTALCICQIKGSPKMAVKLADIQQTMQREPIKVVLDNVTRWDSLLARFQRFIELKDVLVLLTGDKLENYDWAKAKLICSLLARLFRVLFRITAQGRRYNCGCFCYQVSSSYCAPKRSCPKFFCTTCFVKMG